MTSNSLPAKLLKSPTRILFRSLLVLFLCCSFYKPVKAQTIFVSTYGYTYSWSSVFNFYIQEWGGQIYKVDLGSCASTVVLPISLGNPTPQFYDIACDPFNPNILYGVDWKDSIYRIDISVPSYTVINGNFNSTHGGAAAHQLNALVSDASGNLYAADGTTPGLYYYNVGANTWTTIGSPGGFVSGGDLTWYNGTLYLTTNSNQLVSVDPGTAATTVVSTLSKTNMFGVVSITNGANCVSNTQMIGAADSSFYSVNPLTGACNLICLNNINGGNQVIFGSATLTEAFNPVPVNVTASAVTPTFCAGGNTTLNAGGGAVSYMWSPGGPGSSISVTPGSTTTYTVTGTNAGGCTGTNTVTVTVNPKPGVGASATSPSICNGSPTTLNATGAVSYSWTPGAMSGGSVSVSPASSVTYTVTGTDGNGCTNTATVPVTVGNAPTVTPVSANPACSVANGSATVNVTAGIANYTYSWSTGANTTTASTTNTLSGLGAGSYTVTVTDASGCSKAQSYTLTTTPAVSTTASSGNATCGLNNGTLNATPSGGNGVFTYSWTSGASTQSVGSVAPGTYIVTVTDGNGCKATATTTINGQAGPTASIVSATQVNCNGSNTGSATAGAIGGTGAYTYSWSPSGGAAATAGSLIAGTYTCTISDANNCTTTTTTVISQPTALSVSTSQTPSNCGAANGSATANVSGGSVAYTYSWNTTPSQTTATATAIAAGTYSVTVTDAKGCQKTSSIIVNSNSGGTAGIASSTNLNCNGAATGAATATITGGTGPFTYSWAPSGGTAISASNLAAGTYTCTITDANNCASASTVVITQPAALTVGTSQTAANCGGTNGSATALPSGGTGAYTYSWNTTPSQSTVTAGAVGAGTYSVTVTDAKGCLQSAGITVGSNPAGTAGIASSANANCNGSATGTATANMTGGTGPFTYSWSPSGGTAVTANNLAAGTYTCTITDTHACVATTTVVITQPTLLTIGTSQTPSNCGASNGSVTVTVSGGTGAYTYSWTTTPSQTTSTATSIPAGSYSVTVTDAKGCLQTAAITVNSNSGGTAGIASSSNLNCNGSANGTATASMTGGTGPFTYSWSPAGGTAITANNLPAGTYTCTITDANNCASASTVVISQPALLSVTTAQVPANCGGSNGTASAAVTGGTGVYTYSWNTTPSQTTASASGIAAGNYSVTVTDANGCQQTTGITVNSNAGGTASIASSTNANCNGSATGTATAAITGGTGPFTYSWSPTGGTAAAAAALVSGTYTCTITDANNCVSSSSVIISQPTLLTVSASSTSANCGTANGSATANVSGGNGAYTYSWNTAPSQTTSTATSIPAGTYSITVTDANGCQQSTGVIVNSNSGGTAGIASSTNANCNGSATGTATAAITGGTAPFTYSWSPTGGTAAAAAALVSGTYTCTITDANGCVSSSTVNISQPTALADTIITVAASCGINNGTATMQPTGGTGSYTYSWSSSGGSTATAAGLAPGTYTCTINDANGCSAQNTAVITTSGALPVATITSSGPTTFCAGTNTTLTATGGGTYSWSNGASTAAITVTTAGNYTVTVSNGCGSNNAVTSITVNPLPVAALTGGGSICHGDSVLLTASGGNTYSWSTGQTAPSIYVSAQGTYSVTATNGCGSSTAQTTVNVGSVTAGFTADSTSGYASFTVHFTNTSSASSTSWAWNFGDGTTGTGANAGATHVFGAAGTYTVTLTVTNANGCTDTYSETIVVNDMISWIHVPNVFTPNGDEVNDLFLFTSQGISIFDVVIYDRWGVQLSELKSPDEGWDGRTIAGEPASNGTYYYILRAEGVDKKVYNQQGFFMLCGH